MTGDPQRLLHDPATAAVLRRDLDVASRGVPFDVDAGLARFESSLAPRLAAGTGSGAGVSGGLALGALLLAGGLAAALGWQLAGPQTPAAPIASAVARASYADRVTHEVPSTIAAKPVVAPVVDEIVEAASAEPVADEVVADETPVAAVVRPPRTRKPRVRDHSSAPQAVDPLREARELNAARGLLGADPGRALKLAEAGARAYRAGTFTQEWEGVAVLALFELGRDDEARARGRQFLARYPSGTYAPQIRVAMEVAP